MPRVLPAPRARRTQLGIGVALLVLLLAPARAHATHVLVDPSGRGDYTTIQAAVSATIFAYRESILIAPGAYPETVFFSDSLGYPIAIVGTGGAAATTLHSMVMPRFYNRIHDWSFSGLTFDQHVDLDPVQSGLTASFCVFREGLTELAGCEFANLHDCEFDGRTNIEGFIGTLSMPFYRLRFVHAPLRVDTGSACGETGLLDCTFIGPADTLVSAAGGFTNGVDFQGCTFSNARHGITGGYFLQLSVSACQFRDLMDDGIDFAGGLGLLYMGRSRFDRCGSAVRWTAGEEPTDFESTSSLGADSVFDCTSDGLVMSGARFDGLDVERCGGNGLVIERSYRFSGYDYIPPDLVGPLQIVNSRFADNVGSGVAMRDTLGANRTSLMLLDGVVATGNGGHGLDLAGARSITRNCVVAENAGDGIRFTSVASHFADQVDSNTVAFNRGAGLRWARTPASSPELQLARHNLVARNGEGGILAAPGPGQIAFNDAWKNRHGDFGGVAAPLDSNLSVDPEFCHDALTLDVGSPCGPGGIYGLIGAEPEVCIHKGNATPFDPIAETGAARFTAQPNPARGAVEFAVPAGGADGRIEVLDAQGRRVWSRAVAAGVRAVWSGETGAGRAPPGLYLARFTRAGTSQLVRIVWIE